MMVSDVEQHSAVAGSSSSVPPSAGPILAIVWLCSLGTAVIWQGVFFIAKEVYEFGLTANYLLAIVGGGTYVASALTAGMGVRALASRFGSGSARSVLMGIMILLSASSALAGFAGSKWTLWAFVAVYSLVTGWMWPLIESFVSSGRTGKDLVRATGRFNIAWASAIPVALVAMSPVLEFSPLMAFQVLAGIHVMCLPLVLLLARAPSEHGLPEVADDVGDPVRARLLLTCFRLLNSLSYVLISLLIPALPLAMVEMEVAIRWRTPLLSTWVIVRIAMFVLLERWHGWHGRWRTPIWSGASLVIGFGLAYFGSDPVVLVAGLALFGVGAGGAYSGAIYYAMDVGKAEVDAGGKHEAILGAGYLAGPALGLAVELIRSAGSA